MSFSMNDNVISLEAYRKCPPNRRKYVKLAAFTEAEHRRKKRERTMAYILEEALKLNWRSWGRREPTSGLRSFGIDLGASSGDWTSGVDPDAV